MDGQQPQQHAPRLDLAEVEKLTGQLLQRIGLDGYVFQHALGGRVGIREFDVIHRHVLMATAQAILAKIEGHPVQPGGERSLAAEQAAQEEVDAAKRADRKARKQLTQEEQKARRDARYAARKARR